MSWDPTHDLLTMQERLESLFGRAEPGWVPAVDLSETPDRYILAVELPGLTRDQIKIDLENGTLTVRGERPKDPCCPDRYHQLERGHGAFSRAFRFTAPVDPDGVSAELADGILTVVVPKLVQAGQRRIDVE